MAKESRAGRVKTRLVPPLAGEEAAALNSCFLRDIAENIVAASALADIGGYAAYSPLESEAFFADLMPAGFGLLAPRETGLGPSLRNAAQDLLAAGHAAVCLVNSDSPTLPTEFLTEAAAMLGAPGERLVLGPADDGGYYLIGLKRADRRLFEDIDWSTELVFTQTLERAAMLGLDAVVLPSWYDVDDTLSLRQLCDELLSAPSSAVPSRIGYAAPHTAAYLRRLAAAGRGDALGIATGAAMPAV